MRYINRWGLMHTLDPENIQEHSASVAMIAHALGVINREELHGDANPDRLAVIALYHDAEEIITGDLPTPVKYFSPTLRAAVKEAEDDAQRTLLSMLPPGLRPTYAALFSPSDETERRLVKAADVIDAYIKCLTELKGHNREFLGARQATEKKLRELGCPEADLFCERFLPAFETDLDEQRQIDPD